MKKNNLLGMVLFFLLSAGSAIAQKNDLMENVGQAMVNATKYMVEEVNVNGGYVALYLPDFSRRWGELEAYETQTWVQSPGTISMGNLYIYTAAEKVAEALIWGNFHLVVGIILLIFQGTVL